MKKLLLSMICAASMTAWAGTGTAEDPYSVAEYLALKDNLPTEAVTVKGYIVGWAEGQNLSTGTGTAHFTADGAAASNVLISDDQNVSGYEVCATVNLPSKSDICTAVNLKDNPGNLGKTLSVTGNPSFYFGVPGLREPSAYSLDGEGGGVTPPTPTDNVTFGYVSTVTSGKKYALVADGKVATPLTSAYGYLPVADVTVANNQVSTSEANGYTIEAVDGGYTIKDSNGKYLYMKGTYNSFNVADSRTDGDVWTIELQANGEMKITNVLMSKYIQYASSYTSYGAYANQTGTMPMLFELGAQGGDVPTPETVEVNSIADFLAAKSPNPTKINCAVTAMYQNGNRLFITDGTTPLLVFGKLNTTYVNGDKIAAGITGTFQDYSNGNLQMSSPVADTFGAPTAGTAVEPEVYQVEELSADMVSAYVKILGVKLAAGTDDKTFTMSDNTGEITLYNQFGFEVSAGEDYTFEGFVAVHSGNLQVLPVVAMSDGGDVPPTPSDDDANVAYFYAPDFTGKTGCALMNKAGTSTIENDDAKVEEKGLNNQEFTEKGVSLVFSHGTGDYYASAFGSEVRWYQGEIATLTPAAGVTITKVFVQTVKNSKGAFTANAGSVDGTGVGATNPITWTGSTTEPLVLTSVKQIRFSYMEVTTTGFSGVENVTVNDENAPVEYYNLQGIRVANPESGVYIRRQGNTVSKVLVK